MKSAAVIQELEARLATDKPLAQRLLIFLKVIKATSCNIM